MPSNIENLIDQIEDWGVARNITEDGGATSKSQMHKCMEELIEWFEADALVPYFVEAIEDKIDAFGDMLVCLIQAMRLSDVTMEECLRHAWEQIKDRKGTMVNGKFVKELE